MYVCVALYIYISKYLYGRKSVLNIPCKDWCWSWNSKTLATWCKELTHWKRPWCWERLKAGGEGDDRGRDGWMASLTQWTWVWVNSGSWWWTGRPGVLQFMGSQRVGHDWETELNWWTGLFRALKGAFILGMKILLSCPFRGRVNLVATFIFIQFLAFSL